jgi:hypothetical protein
MADHENDPVVDDATITPSDDVAYTPTAYDLLAAEILNDLDAVAAKIAKLEYPHRSTAKFIRSHANIPRPFLETAVAIVGNTPELQTIGILDVWDDGYDTLQFDRAFKPVADRLAALTMGLRHTLSARRARLGAKALQVYAILKGLARHGGIDLVSKVQNLARDLGPRGRPKSKPAAG